MKNELGGLFAALSTFTIIPMPAFHLNEKSYGRSLVWLPAAGVAIGSVWSIGAWLCLLMQRSGVTPILCAAITAAIPIFMSGFIHLDGFMDCCDALLSRRSKEDMLRILKDPGCGAFAVISVLATGTLYFASVYSILNLKMGLALMFAIPIISRCFVVASLLSAPLLQGSSMAAASSAYRKKSDRPIMFILMLIVLITIGIYNGVWAAASLIAALAPAYLACQHCIKKFGGVGGDVGGFTLVIYSASACLFSAVLGGIFA